MEPARASSNTTSAVVFQDGLGDRRRTSDATGEDTLELLCLRRELTAIPSFEFALRERASRLANFRHTYFGRVRSVDRLNDPGATLAIASESTRGIRLSHLLTPSERRPVTVDINAALHLLRQIVSAVAMLHESDPDIAHGAIGPERIIVTPNARVVIVEYVLGAALEQLHLSTDQYWRDLRVALPVSSDEPRFDQRADVTQLGIVGLSLILGRLLTDDEYPSKIREVLSSAWAISSRGGLEPLPPGLRSWLARALQLDPRHSFVSALDARTELDRVLSGEDENAEEADASEDDEQEVEISLEDDSDTADEDQGYTIVTAPMSQGIDGLDADQPIEKPTAPQFALPPTASASPIATVAPPVAVVAPTMAAVAPTSHAFASVVTPTPMPTPTPTPIVDPPIAVMPAHSPMAFVPGPMPTAVVPPSAPASVTAVTPPPVFVMPSPVVATAPPPMAAMPSPAAVAPSATAFVFPSFADIAPAPSPSIPTPSARPSAPPPSSSASIPAATVAPAQPKPSPKTPIPPPAPVVATHEYQEEPEFDMATLPPPPRPWARIAAVAVCVIALSGGVFAAKRYFSPAAAAAVATGQLSITSTPAGAAVLVDGEAQGATPVVLTLKAGTHMVELRGAGEPRSLPITLTAGAQMSQYVELSGAAPAKLGQLQVRTEPAGAQVSVDGIARGKSPVVVADLTPGQHMVVLESDLGTVRQSVSVEAATTASLVVPLGAAEGALVSGWISVAAPVDLQIFENRKLLGTSQTDRIMVAAGRHEIEIVNEPLGYRTVRTVQVAPGKLAPIKLDWPKGTIALQAVPWAEVWIDGDKVGETPIGNLSLAVGPHEIVFRHPDLGEQRHAAIVTVSTPARLSVDLRKKQ